MNFSTETSLRYENNPYQDPPASSFRYGLFSSTPISKLTAQDLKTLRVNEGNAHAPDGVFRTTPNITAGWCLSPNTRVYGNYFMLNDSLLNHTNLNTVVQSVGGGIQHDIRIGAKGILQLETQARELFQSRQIPVFDYIPAITYSYAVSPKVVCYSSALLQLRGKAPFQAPTREIDPFYNFGFFTQRGRWGFSNNNTFVQNFRQTFGSNALLPVNNWSWILDFEVNRTVSKKIPGLVAFVRAEPIFNLHSRATPGLSGFDFRLYGGLRLALSKPPLSAKEFELKQRIKNALEQQAKESSVNPPPASPPPAQNSPATPSSVVDPSSATPDSRSSVGSPTTPPLGHPAPSLSAPPPGPPAPSSSAPPPGSPAPQSSAPLPGSPLLQALAR